MENPEEILHSLEEFGKMKPKDIPRELEEYLCFVAKTGDPVYQWSVIKSLFREKLVNVITEFYETCPSVEIPPCPNVDLFNYDSMKNFILEKLDTFVAAPFTVQRICELLTTPRKEYNRIDKYMRALEKNILVVSTVEPGGNRRSPENGEGIVNGLESEHMESISAASDINVDVEMEDVSSWPKAVQTITENLPTGQKILEEASCSTTQDTVITCRTEEPYVSIEPVKTCPKQETVLESDVSVTITAIPAGVQKRRNSVEPVVSSESVETNEEKAEEQQLVEEINADSSSTENGNAESETVREKTEELETNKMEIIDVLPAIEEITCSKIIEEAHNIELKQENDDKIENDNSESKIIENEISSSIINNEVQSSDEITTNDNSDNTDDNNEAKSCDNEKIDESPPSSEIEENVELVEEKTISEGIDGGGENIVTSDLNVLDELKGNNEEPTTTTVADSSDLPL